MLDCVIPLTFGWETTTHLVQPDVHVGSAAPKTYPYSGRALLSRCTVHCDQAQQGEKENMKDVCAENKTLQSEPSPSIL